MSAFYTINNLPDFNKINARENTISIFFKKGCKKYEAIMPAIEKMAAEHRNFVFSKICILDNPNIAALFNIYDNSSAAYHGPTVIVFIKNILTWQGPAQDVINQIEILKNEKPKYWQTFDPNC